MNFGAVRGVVLAAKLTADDRNDSQLCANTYSPWEALHLLFTRRRGDCNHTIVMTSRSSVTKLIALIPKDNLRPHANFGATLTSRIDEFTTSDVAALQSLTSNRFKEEVRES